MIESLIFTRKELSVIDKKIKNKRLNQTDSNYLYRFIRPKLKEISSINAKYLLDKMEYNQKIKPIEEKIKKIILGSLKETDSIILYGSVVFTNYQNYNDIDIMIVTKSKISSEKLKYQKIREIKENLKNNNIISDIEIISKENLINSYKNSPTLIYELNDHKVIYGNIKVPNKIELYNIDLQMKLDWSEIPVLKPTGNEVYSALRNTVLVRLLLKGIIDNSKLKESLNNELGKNLIERLKTNQQSKIELTYAIDYLNKLIIDTRKQIKGDLWERIEPYR